MKTYQNTFLPIMFAQAALLLVSPVACPADNLFTTDRVNGGTINEFDTATASQTVFAQFPIAGGLALDSVGNLYVGFNGGIEQFNSSGVGRFFAAPSTFTYPEAMAFDRAGNLYVAGEGGPGTGTGYIERFNSSGVGTFFANTGPNSNPRALAFDSAGNLYVSLPTYNEIEKFNPSGAGTLMPRTGLSLPVGLAVDSAGNLYAANSGNNTIEKFNSSGMDLGAFADFNQDGGGNLAFDSAGNLYFANQTIIEKFNSSGVDLGVLAPDAAGADLVIGPVPEPSPWALLAAGLLGLYWRSRFINLGGSARRP